MTTLTISDDTDSFDIEGRDIINLEIKLNMTEYGKEWINIGDHLFNFYNLIGFKNQPSNILRVKDFQYLFLKQLKDKSYNQVYKEKFGNI